MTRDGRIVYCSIDPGQQAFDSCLVRGEHVCLTHGVSQPRALHYIQHLSLDTATDKCDATLTQTLREIAQPSPLPSHRAGLPRAIVMQKKTQRPVQFEVTEQTGRRCRLGTASANPKPEQFRAACLKPPLLTTRQYSGR